MSGAYEHECLTDDKIQALPAQEKETANRIGSRAARRILRDFQAGELVSNAHSHLLPNTTLFGDERYANLPAGSEAVYRRIAQDILVQGGITIEIHKTPPKSNGEIPAQYVVLATTLYQQELDVEGIRSSIGLTDETCLYPPAEAA